MDCSNTVTPGEECDLTKQLPLQGSPTSPDSVIRRRRQKPGEDRPRRINYLGSLLLASSGRCKLTVLLVQVSSYAARRERQLASRAGGPRRGKEQPLLSSAADPQLLERAGER